MKKQHIIALVVAAVALGALWGAWARWLSPTRVAFVNYQVITLGEISKANDNGAIRLYELGTDDLERLGRYDMVFINAMGLRITEAQRAIITEAADKGVPILTIAATNPANAINSLDSLDRDSLRQYVVNGGRRNYRSMLNFVRKRIDRKWSSLTEPEPVQPRATEMLYHRDPQDPDGEERGFNSVADYDAFLKANGLWKDYAPRIVVTGVMGEPHALIAQLEETGNVVYGVRSMRKFVLGPIDSVQPAAVVNMAHGRMGDYIVQYLTERNIPLFAPLNVNQLASQWEEDPMGMQGGFLSQSVVTPEIDGALRPYVVFAHEMDAEGMQRVIAIPERMETFVQTINNHIALKAKPNREKRVAIYYYKGPGQSALTATGMEVVPSLFNLLVRMKAEGYNVDGLPATAEELGQLLQAQGAVFGTYAEGAFDDFMQSGQPALVGRADYEAWVAEALQPEMYAEVVATCGDFPGRYMATADGQLGVARVQLGNIALLPQPMAGVGDDAFQIVHGTDAAPPHTYVAAYLWTRYAFQADALIHFGTHGSLEFTPRKQAALSSRDWPDALIGSMPHFYVYSIADVGEGMIAKRRSYAALQSHITPPFMESNLRTVYGDLTEAIHAYNALLSADDAAPDTAALRAASLKVKQLTLQMGIHRALGLDSIAAVPYAAADIQRIEQFGEEVANEKITGQLYTLGEPYEPARIESSVYAMATDPIAYSLLALDKLRGTADPRLETHQTLFTQRYLEPARQLVAQLMVREGAVDDAFVCRIAGITPDDLAKAHEIDEARNAPQKRMAMMMAMAEEAPAEAASHADLGSPATDNAQTASSRMPEAMRQKMKEKGKGMNPKLALKMAKLMGASEEDLKKMEAAMSGKQDSAATGTPAGNSHPAGGTMGEGSSSGGGMSAMMKKMMAGASNYPQTAIDSANAILEVERTLKNVGEYRRLLLCSPENELAALINALNGGYTAPSPGGDPIANPNTLPTGRNLFAINAEETPTADAWEKGKALAESTIKMYREHHNDSLPRKVSYTLWSGEFIESGGATIAQVLYMLGVEPLRDTFGRVTDLRLIPSAELGRARIDVVVQTSGQLRDIATSRLFLINRAVQMAAAAEDDQYTNQVAEGIVEAERVLIEKGLTPKEARRVSTYRVFGGLNGGYGTGIQGMVTAGDRWESETEIADVYMHNMGAFYGSEEDWESVAAFAFEAALTRTDAVVQPRQSNTWGALSLDHVYEFMGGLDLAVRNVTGKDPDAYLSDYRNRNHARMQEVKEAIAVESRTTLFNPTYIKEKMKGGATAASTFAELVTNTYGWNVMKPDAIDQEMWDEVYETYVQDKHGLGVRDFFERQSPAALQEMTAVMMETARKGMWQATPEQLADIAALHTELVNEYKPACSGFVCDNAKLRQFIADKAADRQAASQYTASIDRVREAATSDRQGVVMKKEEMNTVAEGQTNIVSGALVIGVVILALIVLVVLVRRRRAA